MKHMDDYSRPLVQSIALQRTAQFRLTGAFHQISDFDILSSFVIRHSSFPISLP